jgi:hypothetical protein
MATFIHKKLIRRHARRRDLAMVDMERFQRTCAALDRAVRRIDTAQP